MTVDAATEADVRRLFYAEHWKKGTIVAQLGVHRDVVDRILSRPKRCIVGPHQAIPTKLRTYVGFIDEVLQRYPRLVGTRLFDMLRERGYSGSVKTLRRYLKRVRPLPKREVFLRVERLIGEQAQVDWAHVGRIQVDGTERALWVFVMVLAYSRALFAELVIDLSVHSLRRSLVRAAVHFGGNARQWLFDNPKIVVIERRGDAARFHPLLLDIAGQFCVEPRLCGVRKPQEKGSVERVIRFLRDRFFSARHIHNVKQGNAQLMKFIAEIANQREHPRLNQRSIQDIFVEEQERLLPLPSILPNTDLVLPVHADKTAFVRFDSNSYSVAAAAARRTLTLVADDQRVRLLDGDVVVGDHRRSWGKRVRVEDPVHRKEILEYKGAARAAKGQDRLLVEVEGIDELFRRWLEVGRSAGAMTVRTLKLLDLYGSTILTAAVKVALHRGIHNPSALMALCEQARVAAAQPIPIPLQLSPSIPDRDVLPHDLGGYDD